ncbi:imm11 family protein [Dethiothermospora halolimnae]|uniref:imm11 family protein n=1 Tax=Dethiothermospora halolimnae TaxID=3114390 RepID=UPI003CCBFAEE
MEYFLLKQDKRYIHTPTYLDLIRKIDVRDINRLDCHKIKDPTIIHIKGDEKAEYLDILHRQIYIISEELKDLMGEYNSNIIFKTIALIDLENQVQQMYYLPIFEEVEALHEQCEFNLNKSVIKKLVLDKEKIGNRNIFVIKGAKEYLVVVRLDVAESILRRNFVGITLEKIKTI